MKYLAIVVTYYPEEKLLRKNISAFINEIDKVLIWENTHESEKYLYRFIDSDKVEYCGDGNNSISRALNYAWRYAKKHGYDFILTMDQDSILDGFTSLKDFATSHLHERIIVGPSLNRDDCSSESPTIITKVETLITSGTLLPVGILDEIGGYDEKLDIDGIDTDISYKADKLGIQLYQLKNVNLVQRFGTPVKRFFCGKEYVISSYSAKRLRSILRAHVYLMRKYSNMSMSTRKYIIKHYVLEKTRDIVLFEEKKLPKLVGLYLGIFEGLFVKL